MNKSELVDDIAQASGLSKVDSEKALNAFIAAVTNNLQKGEEVRLVGFGTFSAVQRAARKARNPQTGSEISIPAKKAPKFTPGKALKEAVR